MVKHLIQWVVCLCLCATGINTAWAADAFLDFHFDKIGTDGWSQNYGEHKLSFDEGDVIFSNANKQASNATISDIPVSSNNGDVQFKLKKGTLSSLEFKCRKWSKDQTITLYYSTDGGNNYTKSSYKSTTFTLSVATLPEKTNAVKFTFSNNKQVGVESLSISYNNPNDNRTAVDITSFQTESGSTTLDIFKSYKTQVSTNQTGWTAHTYTSSDATVATVDANGDIRALKVGSVNITAKANVAEGDTTYQVGSAKTLAIKVVDNRKVVNLTDFTASQSKLTVGETTSTQVNNNQANWTAAYTFTSCDPAVASVDDNGVVTALTKGTAKITVEANLDAQNPDYKAGTVAKTLNITVVNPSHKVTFSANGEISETELEENEAVTFPEIENVPANAVLAGWSTTNVEGIDYHAPELVNTQAEVMGNSNKTYYAVFARIAQNGTCESDTLTEEIIKQWNDKNYGYGDLRTREHGEVTWSTTAYAKKNNGNLQLNNDKGETNKGGAYIAFEASYNIREIKYELESNATIFIRTKPVKNANKAAYVATQANAASGNLSINGDYTKLYMQSSNVAYVNKIILFGNFVEPTYAGYFTNTASEVTPRTYDVTVAACGYTSVCLPYNAKAPEGAKFFALKSVDGEGLHFSKTDTLAAGQGYVLQGEAGAQYTLTEVTKAVDYNANMLKGVVEQTNCENLQLQGSGDYAYPWILAKDGTFKRYTGTYIPAGKAYLDGALLQNLGGSGAATMRVILEEDEVTALSQLHEEKATAPCFYNLQGQRVAQPRQAGALYIESNGRKIIVK